MAIETPFICKQSWYTMKDGVGGKFCEDCNKTVFDLRNKSRQDVDQLIENHGGEICGYYDPRQVVMWNHPKPSDPVRSLRWLVAASLTVGLSTLSAQTTELEQQNIPFQGKSLIEYLGNYAPAVTDTFDLPFDLTKPRYVVDEEGLSMIAANLWVYGSEAKGTSTDFDGMYQFTENLNLSPLDSIEISYIGYCTQRFLLHDLPDTIVLKEDTSTIQCHVVGTNTVQQDFDSICIMGAIVREALPRKMKRKEFRAMRRKNK